MEGRKKKIKARAHLPSPFLHGIKLPHFKRDREEGKECGANKRVKEQEWRR